MSRDILSLLPQLINSPSAIANLSRDVKLELISLMEGAIKDVSGWPKVFVNRDTLRPYTPHTVEEAAFVYDDVPRYGLLMGGEGSGKSTAGIIKVLNRVKRGMTGMMCCVAPETLINGIPIAERNKPGPVGTIWGSSWATAGFLEGRADLFRVLTESGESVSVTRNHRFLIPLGWRRLEDLRVGDVIAADDTWCAHFANEIWRGSRGGYLENSHLCGALSSPEAQCGPGKQLRPFSSERHRVFCEGSFSTAYIGDHWCSGWDVEEGQLHADSDRRLSEVLYAFQGLSSTSCRFRSRQLSASCQSSLRLDSDDPLQICRACAGPQRCGQHSCQSQQRFPSGVFPHQIDEQLQVPVLYPYANYTTKVRWTQIESVTFLRNGEYYDLMVPEEHHYSSQGIFNHNSPDLPHFQRSLWKEFQRWCPWDMVIPSHRRMAHLSWVPSKPFDIVYENGAYIHGVGVKNAGSLEGPNLNFVHFDEARHYPDKSAITVLDGRVRIPGPQLESPQLWYTTTPRMNWLFEFFGPVQCKCLDCEATHRGEYGIDIQGGQPLICPECQSPHLSVEDPFFVFKKDSRVVRLETQMNDINLMKDFSIKRGQSLTPKEAEVLLLGRWGEIEEGQPFILTPHWWDQCKDERLPPLTRTEPMVIALDAATGREFSVSDCFALMVVTRHPLKPETVAIRYYRTWQAQARGKIDFQGTKEDPGPERVLLDFCGYDLESDGRYTYHEDRRHAVMDVVFDPTELHDMATRLTNASVVAFHSLGQTNKRMEADRQLLNLIQSRRIAHDGSSELRMHLLNADRKLDTSGKKLRIVKRTKTQRIDLAVALSMASHEILRLNI